MQYHITHVHHQKKEKKQQNVGSDMLDVSSF
jgi:hypothetical protein